MRNGYLHYRMIPVALPRYVGKKLSLGYTLIELVIVLLIFGLLSGLVMPRLVTLYHRFHLNLERETIIIRISQLGYLAFEQARSFKLNRYPVEPDMTDLPPLELPVGWQLQTDQPILFQSNGVCSGGIVHLIYEEEETVLQLDSPFCQISL